MTERILEPAPAVNLLPQPAATKREPKSSQIARNLAEKIQDTRVELDRILEMLVVATDRGLTDSLGVGGSGGERVGGTKDHTQRMLDRLEQADDSRKHLSKLVDAVDAAHAMSTLARSSAAFLVPLGAEKARLVLGDGPSKCGNIACLRDVWNTPRDHLRAGRCFACYRYWDRHDRAQERPESLCKAGDNVTEAPEPPK